MAQLFQMTEAEMELFKQRVSKSILQTGIWRGQFKLRHEAGYEFDASLITTLVSDGSGQPMGAVTVFRDVSQEKQIELQKTRFIANASHELRTPIANLKPVCTSSVINQPSGRNTSA